MLITEININFIAGNGGDGKSSFYKSKRGRDGGNGGDGGNIYITTTTDIYALSLLSKNKIIKAQQGQDGMSNKKSGQSAPDLEIKLPIGAIVTDKNSGEFFEIINKNQRILICKGGHGGKGNWEYRTSNKFLPDYAQKGSPGQQRNLNINLKLIADCGFIGFPNAGKSSLLKAITNANPKIADYPFTTLEPNLGEYKGKIITDIPGLIQKASLGKGLGIKFLKHIERVTLIFHCLSCELPDSLTGYHQIRDELKKYNDKLLRIPEIILITKTDLKTEKEIKSIVQILKKFNKKILPISILNPKSLVKLKQIITKI